MTEWIRMITRNSSTWLAKMDRGSWTSLSVSLVLLIAVLVVYFFGQQWLHLDSGDSDSITALMAKAGAAPLALLAVMAIFVVLALIGFPQILMIAACVLTFGPITGAVYAWASTMVSASATFGLGALMGGQWVNRISGERFLSLKGFLSRRGILASGLIRVVPSAPFIVINATAGAAHLPIWKFWLGTAIGIVPKIAFVAGVSAMAPEGQVIQSGFSGLMTFFKSREPVELFMMILIIPLWLGFLWLMRKLYLRLRDTDNSV